MLLCQFYAFSLSVDAYWEEEAGYHRINIFDSSLYLFNYENCTQ